MGKFKRFINEAFGSLSVPELVKRPKRVDIFIDKMESGSPFTLNTGEVITLNNDKKIIKALRNDLDGFKGKNPKYVFQSITANEYKLTDFQKSSDFGGGGKGKSSKGGEDKTTLQEVGVLVWVDALINKQTLENYTPSTKLSVKADVRNVITFLQDNPSWNKSTLASAKTILSNFPEVKAGYTFNHDDNTFNAIRRLGKKLSKLSTADKWNPSDVYFIKNANAPTDNIYSYNDFIFNRDNMIGISLKKGEKEAVHGSYSLMNASSDFNIPFQKNKFRNLEDAKPTLIKYIKSMSNKNYYVKIKDSNLYTSIENLNPTSDTFLTSVIPIFNFFDKIKENKLDDAIKYSILTAMSMSPTSCAHWKLEGAKLTKVPSTEKRIDIHEIILPLDGTSNALINYNFNGKPMLCSLRSKGSLPQFNILKSTFKGNIKSIKSIS